MAYAGEKEKIYGVLAAAIAGACAGQPASLAGAAHRSLASALKMHCNCKIIGGGLSLGTPLLYRVSCPCPRLDSLAFP
jgi:hypothetical protein